MKSIYIGSDHTGIEMKNAIIKHLIKNKYNVIDITENISFETSSSYSKIGIKLGEKVVENHGLGIAICGTGVGISIAANKVKGIRAGLVYELETAKLIKQHNNANILATGARLIAIDKAIKLVDVFLETNFEGGRHNERIKKIDEYNQ